MKRLMPQSASKCLKTLILGVFLVTIPIKCYAFDILGIGKIAAGLLGLTKTVETGNRETMTGLANVQVKMGDINTNLSANLQMMNTINNKMDMQAQVQAKVMAGVDKSLNNTAGRDINTKQINDPKIFYWIISALSGIIMFLLRDSVATRKWLFNALESKKKEVERGDTYKQKYMEIISASNSPVTGKREV